MTENIVAPLQVEMILTNVLPAGSMQIVPYIEGDCKTAAEYFSKVKEAVQSGKFIILAGNGGPMPINVQLPSPFSRS